MLAEILHRAASVARPFVARPVRTIVDGYESQLAEPVGEVASLVDVTCGDARTHGYAEHGVAPKRHRGGQGGDVAVVEDFEWHAIGLGQIQEDIPHLGVEDVVIGDSPEERCDADLVVHVDAGRRTADGVHARQMAGGEIQ